MKRNSLALGITISPTYASVTGVNELIAEQLGGRERGDRKITREIVAKLRKSKGAATALDVLEPLFVLIPLLLGTAFLVDGSFNPFLYFRF